MFNALRHSLSGSTPAGRETPVLPAPGDHPVLGTPLNGPWPEGSRVIYLAAGCFWGVERILWRQDGIVSTSVGYMGGQTPNPTYQEVCTGATGHAETVRVVYDPAVCGEGGETLLRTFWENHDSTHLNRHGNDVGTQYRSVIYTFDAAQKAAAMASRESFQAELAKAGYDRITTEIADVPPFYYAEAYHQQYLAKNPNGYCGLGGTGVCLPA